MKEGNNQSKPDDLWRKSSHRGLVRYVPTRVYFARLRVGGKLIRRSLKTTSLTVAKLRLTDLEKQERQTLENQTAVAGGKMTFNDALKTYLIRLHGDQSIKPRSKEYREERIASLLKSWPGLGAMDVRRITKASCLDWAARYGAKYAPSNFNNTFGTLRLVLEISVEAGIRYDNPARFIKRARVTAKKLDLPSPEQFEAFIDAIDRSGLSCCHQAADLVRFLSYGGFRRTEASNITWGDLNFAKGEILVRITKNGRQRRVPMIGEMRVLLERLRAARPDEPTDAAVMQVAECQISMTNAAKAVGMPRITHHDLRHLFITRCIESGVDIPTAAKWAGHLDGGALAMKVYGHLRDHHSTEMARKVSFSTKEADNVLQMPKEAAR